MALLQFQREGVRAVREAPGAGHACRHDPQEHLARADAVALVGFPVAHPEHVRGDARAGLERKQLRAQLDIQRREQIQRDDRGVAQVGLEEVGLAERDAVGHPLTARLLAAGEHEVGAVLDAAGARAPQLGRGDGNAPVARAEIDHEIVRPDARHLEHSRHRRIRGGNPHDVLPVHRAGLVRDELPRGGACRRRTPGGNSGKDRASVHHGATIDDAAPPVRRGPTAGGHTAQSMTAAGLACWKAAPPAPILPP